MNTSTKRMAHRPTLRALALWRTIWAARSSVSPTVWAVSGAVKRSMLGGTASRRASSRPVDARGSPGPEISGGVACSPGPPGWVGSVIDPRGRLEAQGAGGRDQARLAEVDRQRPQGQAGGVHEEDPLRVDLDRPAIHAPRRRAELRDLDPQAVVARAVAGALEPLAAVAEVRLAAEVRAALVERAHVRLGARPVGPRPVALRIRTGGEAA